MKTLAVTFALLLSAAFPAFGIFIESPLVPVDRIVRNTEAWLREHPEDIEAIYTVARAHYLAFASNSSRIRAFGDKETGWHPTDMFGQGKLPLIAPRKHAEEAVTYFQKAIQARPDNALYQLGLASLYLEYVERAEEKQWQDHPANLHNVTWETVREAFYKAFELSRDEALAAKYLGVSGEGGFVAYEAGERFLKLADRVPTGKADPRYAKVKALMDRVENLPQGKMTPMLVADRPDRQLRDVVSERAVRFDLDGDGAAEPWLWVKPQAGILVWLPDRSVPITSGRQLFGNASWWMFFPDGYRAMDALDDNRDRQLTGPELQGIAIWNDLNEDGQSGPGEIRSLDECGIQALQTVPAGTVDGQLWHPRGALLSGGELLPTWDWISRRVGEATSR